MKRCVLHANFRISKGLDGECREGEVYNRVLPMESTPRIKYVSFDGVEGIVETRD